MKKFKYSFKNGLEVNGTVEQIVSLAEQFGEPVDYEALGMVPTGYYLSSSKGLVKIKEMNTTHMVNALNKRVTTYLKNIRPKDETPEEIRNYLVKFTMMSEDQFVGELFHELNSRT